ncbi:MAG: hypothetical protein JOZ81_31145 [Chloroflexi bacterium]|nr:hypothetical protein [Chloroflexota bacterium]
MTHVVSNLNVVTLGFLGAYFFSIGVLIRRFFATDLYPAAFLQMIYRLLVVVVISLFLSIVVPLLLSLPGVNTLPDNVAGLPTRPMAGGSLSGQVAIAGTLAFFFAVFFGQFTPWLSRVPALLRVRGLDRGKPDKNLHAPVSKLEGVDLWVESRLAEESVETVQAMAGVPIDKLVRRTYFSTAQIVCWVDQAILYMHAGNSGEWMTAFRKAGIHKGTDLLRAIGYGDALTQIDLPQDAIIRPVVDLDKVNNAVMTLVAAADVKSTDGDEPDKGDKSDAADKTDKTAKPGKTDKPDAKPPKLTGPTVFEIAAAVWAEPNLEYLVNFYNAHKVNIRPRPSAGTVPSPQPAPEKPVAVA